MRGIVSLAIAIGLPRDVGAMKRKALPRAGYDYIYFRSGSAVLPDRSGADAALAGKKIGGGWADSRCDMIVEVFSVKTIFCAGRDNRPSPGHSPVG